MTERSGRDVNAALPSAILLDLDDTILASSDVADECWKALCVRYASDLPGVSAETLYASVSQWRDWFWSDAERHRVGRNDLHSARRQIVRMAFEDQGIDAPRVAQELADAYTMEREKNVRPFPGAIETLKELHRRGIPLGLVTNGSSAFQRAKIDRFNLQQYFRVILIEGEFGPGKPAKSVFEHALKAVDCLPVNAWMVGDSLMYDVEPALKLGMHGVWMDFACTGLPQSPRCIPSRIVSSLSEIGAWLPGNVGTDPGFPSGKPGSVPTFPRALRTVGGENRCLVARHRFSLTSGRISRRVRCGRSPASSAPARA